MGYYIAVAVGAVVGFFLGVLLSSASREDERCINCRHHRQVPGAVPDWLGKGHLTCVACRGSDYDVPQLLQTVSLVKPDSYCNEFQPEGGDSFV